MVPSQLPVSKPRRNPRLAGAAVVIALAAAAVYVASRDRTPASDAPPHSDLPRLEGAAIVLPPAFEKMAGIATQVVQTRAVAKQISVPGQVAFDPEHVAAVGTRARGLVEKIFKFEGDEVQPFDLLAAIDSPDLSHAQGDALALKAQAEAAKANARREQSLHKDGMTTTRDLELATATAAEQSAHLAAARAKVATMAGESTEAMGMYNLRAPLAGVVIERALHTGQTVEANVVAFRVANLDQLWVELAVGERYLGGMKRGDPVEIRPIAHPEHAMTGELAYVGDVIDPLSGTAPVRVKIANLHRQLRPGQSVTATIRMAQVDRDSLAVPLSAVTPIDGKLHVFLEVGPHRVQPTPVETGASDEGWVEIRSGLKAGDRVATSGVFALKSELYR